MKKVIATVLSSLLLVALGLIGTTPANAVNCRALNQGTYNAYHVHSANGNGLVKIANECHPG